MILELFSGGISGSGRFTVHRKGYDPAAVDAYLDSLLGWNPHAPNAAPSASEVMDKMFPTVRRGYDQAEVHRHLYALAGGGDMKQLAA